MEQRQARDCAAFLISIVALGALVLAALPLVARADEGVGPVTNLPLPRYVSLRSSEINVRRGPGLDYRKDWVFRREGLPVKIVDEYGDWRRIVDKDDAGGWVYHAMLTGRRTVLIVEDGVVLRDEPTDAAPANARAEQGVVARLESCGPAWCEVEAGGYSGWVRKAALWGVEPGELVED
jgi:SH3-like domain-containing protein